jgi:cytochrome c
MTSVGEVVVLAAALRPGTFALCSSLMHEVSASSPGGRPARPVSPEQESSRMRSLFLAAVIVAAPGAALAQDAAAGEKTFAQCRACHQVGPTAKNAVGPVLNGLFGRKSGTVEGYNYTAANKDSGIVWDEATFTDYIKDPKAKIPGTKMVYAGLKDEQRIKDLIAYLKQFDASGQKKAM